MTDKPEIKRDAIWTISNGDRVRILATDAMGDFPVVGQYLTEPPAFGTWTVDGRAPHHQSCDLISLAPSTLKREVALYRNGNTRTLALEPATEILSQSWRRISEVREIEFTLLPGESAE